MWSGLSGRTQSRQCSSVGDFLSSAKEASHLFPELVEERGAGLCGRKDLFVETVVTGSSRLRARLSRLAHLAFQWQYCGTDSCSALQQGPVPFPTPFIHGQECSISTQVLSFSFSSQHIWLKACALAAVMARPQHLLL